MFKLLNEKFIKRRGEMNKDEEEGEREKEKKIKY